MLMVYRYPSRNKTNKIGEGSVVIDRKDKVDYLIIDEKDKDSTIKKGWYLKATDAINSDNESKRAVTREELEQKAKELDIIFNKDIADSTLRKKINKAIKEKE